MTEYVQGAGPCSCGTENHVHKQACRLSPKRIPGDRTDLYNWDDLKQMWVFIGKIEDLVDDA